MARISIDQAREGMVLSAEVVDRRGRLLIPAGKEITQKHLAALRMWGIPSLEIAGDEPEGPAEAPPSPEVMIQVEADMDDLFGAAGPPHPFLDELRRIATRRLTKELAGRGAFA